MKLKRSTRILLYVLLIVFMLLTLYSIFNTGNPDSLFRVILSDPAYDLVIAVGLALCVGVLVILITASREHNSLEHLLDINSEYIHELRSRGRTDTEIAESFLDKLGSRQGLLHRLAKRRVLRYLSKL
jgi:uncharacterized membrane protein YccC